MKHTKQERKDYMNNLKAMIMVLQYKGLEREKAMLNRIENTGK